MSTPSRNPFQFILLLVLTLCISFNATSQLLEVGSGYPYGSLSEAADVAVPGDTILIHEGIYPGGVFVADLQGTSSEWIYILAAQGESVIFEGGTNAWQFTDAAYLEISGFTFQHQTGNGLNFDDGGSYETPAHHVIFDHCTFRDMNASGNNDMLKLSGLDYFEVRHCTFFNGATGGSGIDMVGCHDSHIYENHFENQGSNSIQAKGGTRNIRIERNVFKNGGARAVNLGGSTGLQFFRPLDAPFESAELKVYSNVFMGSEAPIAYVGTINTEVVNNTIYLPTKWVMRILQETVDTSRFPPCGYNTFRNNIIYIDNHINVECNIGPNTAPETFTFSNNLWFHSEDGNWPGPDLPAPDEDNIIGEDPLFENSSSENFALLENSPAIGNGFDVSDPEIDFTGGAFLLPRSIGAHEGGEITGIENIIPSKENQFTVYPNPANELLTISFKVPIENGLLSLISITGENEIRKELVNIEIVETFKLSIPADLHGVYILLLEGNGLQDSQVIIIE